MKTGFTEVFEQLNRLSEQFNKLAGGFDRAPKAMIWSGIFAVIGLLTLGGSAIVFAAGLGEKFVNLKIEKLESKDGAIEQRLAHLEKESLYHAQMVAGIPYLAQHIQTIDSGGSRRWLGDAPAVAVANPAPNRVLHGHLTFP